MQGRGRAIMQVAIANVRAHAYAIAMHIVVVTSQDDEDNMKDYISRHKKSRHECVPKKTPERYS